MTVEFGDYVAVEGFGDGTDFVRLDESGWTIYGKDGVKRKMGDSLIYDSIVDKGLWVKKDSVSDEPESKLVDYNTMKSNAGVYLVHCNGQQMRAESVLLKSNGVDKLMYTCPLMDDEWVSHDGSFNAEDYKFERLV